MRGRILAGGGGQEPAGGSSTQLQSSWPSARLAACQAMRNIFLPAALAGSAARQLWSDCTVTPTGEAQGCSIRATPCARAGMGLTGTPRGR